MEVIVQPGHPVGWRLPVAEARVGTKGNIDHSLNTHLVQKIFAAVVYTHIDETGRVGLIQLVALRGKGQALTATDLTPGLIAHDIVAIKARQTGVAAVLARDS